MACPLSAVRPSEGVVLLCVKQAAGAWFVASAGPSLLMMIDLRDGGGNLVGRIDVRDLSAAPRIELPCGFDGILLSVAYKAFEGLARRAGASIHAVADHLSDLWLEDLRDETIAALAGILKASPRHGDGAPTLFDRQLILAMCSQFLDAHVGLDIKQNAHPGLARWQLGKAKELLGANLQNPPCLAVVAEECGLSVSHFSRAFRQTVGIPPRSWFNQRRIQAAKGFLADVTVPLAAIALECGFADQSHFTRTFSRSVGVSPGAWRRAI